MGSAEGDDDLEAALAAAYKVAPEYSGVDPKARRARERRFAMSPHDGRRGRKTGRTEQFNTRVTAELKKRIVKASKMYDTKISEMADRAFTAFLDKLEGGRREGS